MTPVFKLSQPSWCAGNIYLKKNNLEDPNLFVGPLTQLLCSQIHHVTRVCLLATNRSFSKMHKIDDNGNIGITDFTVWKLKYPAIKCNPNRVFRKFIDFISDVKVVLFGIWCTILYYLRALAWRLGPLATGTRSVFPSNIYKMMDLILAQDYVTQ